MVIHAPEAIVEAGRRKPDPSCPPTGQAPQAFQQPAPRHRYKRDTSEIQARYKGHDGWSQARAASNPPGASHAEPQPLIDAAVSRWSGRISYCGKPPSETRSKAEPARPATFPTGRTFRIPTASTSPAGSARASLSVRATAWSSWTRTACSKATANAPAASPGLRLAQRRQRRRNLRHRHLATVQRATAAPYRRGPLCRAA